MSRDHPYTIAVDFDGTLCGHDFPRLGPINHEAVRWLRELRAEGARLILWTMRTDGQEHGDVLTQAVEAMRAEGLEFDHVNANPGQEAWTRSPKVYANAYVDDSAIGCPMRSLPGYEGSAFRAARAVDFAIVGPELLARLRGWNLTRLPELLARLRGWNLTRLAKEAGR